MQALSARPKLWPFQIERKEDGLYIFYKRLFLDRIQTTEYSNLASFVLNQVISPCSITTSVHKGSREYYAWANLRLTRDQECLDIDILHVKLDYNWKIVTNDQAKTLKARVLARFFILLQNQLQFQSSLGHRCHVFHLDDLLLWK